ncbi:MAG: HD domain-containing phosphohydrolase [Acidobacteriota bacterium]
MTSRQTPPPEARRFATIEKTELPEPKRGSMMPWVLAILVFTAVVPTILVGYEIASDVQLDLDSNQKELQLERGTRLGEDIGSLLHRQFERMRTYSDGISSLIAASSSELGAEAGGEQRQRAVARLRGLLERYNAAEQHVGGRGRTDRLVHLSLSVPGLDTIEPPSPRFDRSLAGEALSQSLKHAKSKGREGVESLSGRIPYGSQSGLAVFAVPVFVQGRASAAPWGVLAAVVSLEEVQTLVETAGGSLGYEVFVTDGAGELVAHGQRSKMAHAAEVLGSALVEDFSQGGFAAKSMDFERMVAGREERIIGTSVPVVVDNENWGVFLQVDRRLGWSQVFQLRRTALRSGLVALACAVAIGIVFSLWITKPIQALSESTRQVASGQYGQLVDVGRKNEIGQLADNFNVMSLAVANTIEGLQRQREINEELFLSTIRSLAAAIDARDPYTRGHSDRVSRYARIIADQMELGLSAVTQVEVGALLHDVGKIGIEDRILRKPSALTPEEFEIMKTHPEKGGDIMAPIAVMRDVTDIIVHHHERWDGSGYPSGLAGEDIPLGARIVNVADTFDAMTTNRPYQRAMTFEVAAAKIRDFAGKAADPMVVDAFTEAMEAGLFDFSGQSSQVG